MGLRASKNLGNMPSCHTLLHRSKNASDALSPAWSDLTFFVMLVRIYPYSTSSIEIFIADLKHYKPTFLPIGSWHSRRSLQQSQKIEIDALSWPKLILFSKDREPTFPNDWIQ